MYQIMVATDPMSIIVTSAESMPFSVILPKTGVETGLIVINEIAMILDISDTPYLKFYKRLLKRFRLSQFAKCHSCQKTYGNAPWASFQIT